MTGVLHKATSKALIFFAIMAFAGVGILSSTALAAGKGSDGDVQSVVKGWSAKKTLLDKAVYNDRNEKIGEVQDIIITTDKNVSYAIIGVGGFLGLGEKYVAIPANKLKISEKKILMPNATKDELQQMPKFDYRKHK
jgi:sporulation protein YlmC with PRC-barrel domain